MKRRKARPLVAGGGVGVVVPSSAAAGIRDQVEAGTAGLRGRRGAHSVSETALRLI